MKRKHYVHVKFHPGGTWMRLYNFPVNRWDLQSEHKQWLEDVAVPFLRENGAHTFIVVGMTSRSGSEARNQILSERRAKEVYEYMKKRGFGDQVDPKLDKPVLAGGERFAATKEMRDGSENDYYRAVEVWLLKNLFDFQPHHIGTPLPENHGMA